MTTEEKKKISELKKEIRDLKLQSTKANAWNTKKFIEDINIFSGKYWGKFFRNTSHILIIGFIALMIFSFGWWKGKGNQDITADITNFPKIEFIGQDNDKHSFEIRDHKVYLDGQIVKVKDSKELRPFGFHFKPKFYLGYSGENDAELGLGAEIAHLWNFNYDIFGTNEAFYPIGISYDIYVDDWVEHATTGIGYGRLWDNVEEHSIIWYVTFPW